jgi:hypothetical protein
MTGFADLEIGLHHGDATSYAVDLRFSDAENETDIRLVRSGLVLVQFDFANLLKLTGDPVAYGQALSQSLFADAAVRAGFENALTSAATRDFALRLRLFIGPSAPELHSLHWETLRDIRDGSLLLSNERILFSRYLSSLDWRPVKLRPKADLQALVVIANPTDLATFQPQGRPLAPLDVAGERERARTSLGTLAVTALASGGTASLDNMAAQLRDGYDVLYLVAHGALIKGEPRLWLENATGAAHVITATELVTRLRELEQRPRLVVLASCQSAGTGDQPASQDAGALAPLGPQLAEAGIPAVLAMQGNITMETVSRFMPVFFKELLRDGEIDRAVAVARGVVRDRADFWAPTLFMRLRTGRIWYVPGFANEQEGFKKWPALIRSISDRRCTPILGAGLTEAVLGSPREMARTWAATYHFPMAPYAMEDLPQVAQYMAVDQDDLFLRSELRQHLRAEILRRYGADLPPELQKAPLEQLLAAVSTHRQEHLTMEPHKVLARLPFPIYVNTNSDPLLTHALGQAGKQPVVEICRWNTGLAQQSSVTERDPDYRPDAEHRPLVYHLFGRLEEEDSVVLTEDNYFDYLIGVTSNKDLIPLVVRRALTDTALLFIGFQMDDWDFRVLFRSLMSQEGRQRRSRYTHVAVQIDPEEGRIISPARARRYLESYFEEVDMSIYWGSAEDFIKDLWQHWNAAHPAGVPA